ncbi:branched-chain amino acid transport system substrate-binding protein [Maridesulfovibrio ferrireducens]|uniref:Branched-chain amino acid transport system substrate-binding protein n=1 Tax=Maridesulfovibrio ferrireducens TaxID=246191 RepID=A0A1G9EDQ6_9BACT|nr:branched-chain amino acid ABC transporter substrate-binding protein [Maridesulfovibrio ferrireducens]SDK74279.1 branched-chain amino acid transport system substrate-binding protein [Maridesulfovibrio ferrireducens]
MKRSLLALSCVLMLTVGFVVFGGEKNAEASAKTILLGVAGAHSGDLASYGLPSLEAAKLVVKAVNDAGGINGVQVVISSQDDQCKPEFATNAAFKLVSDEVTVVLGHICSGATKAALPIYKESNLVCMSPSATTPTLTQSGDYPNFFRTIASDDAQAALATDFAIDTLGLKKIAVIHDKGDYGKGFADFAKKYIEESSKADVVLFEGVTPGAVDYSAVVQKIKASGADSVIFGGYHPEASKIVSQIRKKKITIPFISDDGVKAQKFINVAGKASEGVYATGPRDITGNPMYKVALDQYKATHDGDPGAFFFEAYSATQALLKAIERAGSTDYEKIVYALRNEEVETPVGKIKFDSKGDALGVGFSMYQVKDGAYQEVK